MKATNNSMPALVSPGKVKPAIGETVHHGDGNGFSKLIHSNEPASTARPPRREHVEFPARPIAARHDALVDTRRQAGRFSSSSENNWEPEMEHGRQASAREGSGTQDAIASPENRRNARDEADVPDAVPAPTACISQPITVASAVRPAEHRQAAWSGETKVTDDKPPAKIKQTGAVETAKPETGAIGPARHGTTWEASGAGTLPSPKESPAEIATGEQLSSRSVQREAAQSAQTNSSAQKSVIATATDTPDPMTTTAPDSRGSAETGPRPETMPIAPSPTRSTQPAGSQAQDRPLRTTGAMGDEPSTGVSPRQEAPAFGEPAPRLGEAPFDAAGRRTGASTHPPPTQMPTGVAADTQPAPEPVAIPPGPRTVSARIFAPPEAAVSTTETTTASFAVEMTASVARYVTRQSAQVEDTPSVILPDSRRGEAVGSPDETRISPGERPSRAPIPPMAWHALSPTVAASETGRQALPPEDVDRPVSVRIPAAKSDEPGINAENLPDSRRPIQQNVATAPVPAAETTPLAVSPSLTVAASILSEPTWRPAPVAQTTQSQFLRAQPILKTLQVQLNPEHLGAVTATLTMSGTQLKVELSVTTREAHECLKNEEQVIEKAVRSLGYDVQQVSVVQSMIVVNASARSDQAMPPPAQSRDQPSGGMASGDGGGRSGNQQGGRHEDNASGAFGAPTTRDSDRRGGGVYI
ncbi:flagellar hook-length control protein FliK [Mesorhizobium yinganensis]|uniref:flagellar hook-length control protein FliK n=1 Tax=Mesorhizobium yinganensis TaxID=3157707 RepID=UPI0032B81535